MVGCAGVHGRGACVVGMCAWQGGIHGRGMHDGGGGMHGRGACMAGGVCGRWGHAWWGACMAHPPPPSRYYEIWSMSGRYASYWNAFLFEL